MFSSKMLSSIFLFIVVLVNANAVSLIAKYKEACDKLDIDSLLKNSQLVTSYTNCLLNKGPCTKYGKEIKIVIPEILSTTCAECSPNQKRLVQRVMQFMHTNRKADFDALFDLYDPEKKYRTSMMHFMIHADDISDLRTPSNGTLHKHSLRSIMRTTRIGSSTTEPSTFTQRKVHLRSTRTTSTSPKPTTDFHRTHKTHATKLTGSSAESSS